MKILKCKELTIGLFDLNVFLKKHNLWVGDKFGVSWKIGKRRKLRSYRIDDFEHWNDDEGYTDRFELTLKKGDTIIKLDALHGPWELTFK